MTERTFTAAEMRTAAEDLIALASAEVSDDQRTSDLDDAAMLRQGADAVAALITKDIEISQLKEDVADASGAEHELQEELDEGKGYLVRLFKLVAPECKPLPTLSGIVSQIDNYTAGQRAALTAAAERETKLREENERLQTTEIELSDRCSERGHAIRSLEAEVERLKADRDSWERCALNTEVTLQAERQKVTTFRNKIETGHKYLTPHRATTLIGWMDALGLVKQPGIVELQSGLIPDPPRDK